MSKNKNSANLAEETRTRIAHYLPDAIDHAIQSYRSFYSTNSTEGAKDFGAHHTACKAAIAHIELLLKLASWAQLPRDSGDAGLSALMADAQAELDKYNGEDHE